MTDLIVTAYGAKGDGFTDSTKAIQTAIGAAKPGDTVVIPAGIFMINALTNCDNYAGGGLFLKSDMVMKLEPGATLQAIPNQSDHYTIVTIKGCSNVSVLGPGTIRGERDKHPQNPGAGQWGFGISIFNGCSNIVVSNLTVANLWGNGITVIGASLVSFNLVIIDGNRRQGLSVIDGNQIKITNCTFKNHQYSGLDLESDTNQTISNVLVQYDSFTNSIEGPAHIGVGSATGTYKNIVIKDCQFDLKMQPIFVHDNGGNTGTPAWAFLYNRIFYQGLHAPWYRFWGYPTSWSGP